MLNELELPSPESPRTWPQYLKLRFGSQSLVVVTKGLVALMWVIFTVGSENEFFYTVRNLRFGLLCTTYMWIQGGLPFSNKSLQTHVQGSVSAYQHVQSLQKALQIL